MGMLCATARRRADVLIATVLQLLAVAPFASVRAEDPLRWSVLVHAGSGAGDSSGEAAIAVGTGYYLTIGLRRCTPASELAVHSCAPATEHGCQVGHASRELVVFGQVPRVIVSAPGTHEERMWLQPQLIKNFSQAFAACAVWMAPLPAAATAAPASLQIVVTADAYGIASMSVQTTVLRIPVLAAARTGNRPLVHAARAQPPLLADVKTSDARWYPRLIPGVSPLAIFANDNGAQPDALCVTVDEFRSHLWVDLEPTAPADAPVAFCQGRVGAVHTRSALIFHSPGKGIEEIRSGAHRVSLNGGLADLCVDRLVVSSQPAPYRRGFSDVVLALEPVGWRRGTGTTIFVRDENFHEHDRSKRSLRTFHEILDYRGVNLATWANQLLTSNAAQAEVTVIGAAFAITQPKTFLFLVSIFPLHSDEQVEAHPSQHQTGIHVLVAFDGLVQRWNRRSMFDDEVQLVGLRYASSARPVLWAWGSVVLFSFDHGHTFHRVAGLQNDHSNNLVVDFVSTTTNEWALLYSDGLVILGCIDSEPRPSMSIPTSPGDKPTSLIFTHEGALVGLSLNCSGGGSGSSSDTAAVGCAPKRSLLAHTTDAWEFSAFQNSTADAVQAGAGTCDSTALSHLHTGYITLPHDVAPPYMLRNHPSEEDFTEHTHENLADGQLPSRIFFDLHEHYRFKLRLPADGELGLTEWRPIAFQLNSAAGEMQMSVESVALPPAAVDTSNVVRTGGHIEYTVDISDAAKSPGQTTTSGLSLDVAAMEKRSPGKDMTVATLQILHDRGSGSSGSALCSNSATVRQQQQHTITLLSGCPPGRRIEFDVDNSHRVPRALNQQRVEVDHGCMKSDSDAANANTDAADRNTSETRIAAPDTVLCVWAGHDFYPVFRIVDDLAVGGTQADNTYNGSYRLTIVAGGPSLDEMQEYTNEQQESYSMWPASLGGKHSSPVYGFINADLEGDRPTVSGMSWICSPGSPCSHVLPRFPQTPEIFLRFRFDTTYSEGTYCDYRTEFTLRLHGLPMAFPIMVRLTFGTTAACFGLVLVSYVVRLAFFLPQQS